MVFITGPRQVGKTSLALATGNGVDKSVYLNYDTFDSSLAGDVECSPNTIKLYVEILESLFIIFRVTPCQRNIGRSLLKEPKIYFFDTGMVKGDDGTRLENLVAASLLKKLHFTEDTRGIPRRLETLRTKEKNIDG